MTWFFPRDRKCETCEHIFLAKEDDVRWSQWKCPKCREKKPEEMLVPQGFSARQGVYSSTKGGAWRR